MTKSNKPTEQGQESLGGTEKKCFLRKECFWPKNKGLKFWNKIKMKKG